jgi:hypothetical protein
MMTNTLRTIQEQTLSALRELAHQDKHLTRVQFSKHLRERFNVTDAKRYPWKPGMLARLYANYQYLRFTEAS